MSWRVGKSKGTITVFLTMVLLVILALIATCLENARVRVASATVERTLTGSLDGAMTEYYEPLYEDYRIFLMDKGNGSDTLDYKKLTEQIQEYMNTSLSTSTTNEITGKEINGVDLLCPAVNSVQVDNVVKATDYGGAPVEEEILQYMKYEVTADGLKSVLENLNLIEESEATATIMEAEGEVTEQFEDANGLMMELMEQVEGICCKDKLTYNEDGTIKVNGYFAKKMCTVEETKVNVGIDNDTVWNALKGHYVNPLVNLDAMKTTIDSLVIEKEKQEQEETNEAQTTKKKETKKKDTKDANVYDFTSVVTQFNTDQADLKYMVSQTREKIEESIGTIEKLEGEIGKLTSAVTNYTDKIAKQKDRVSEETYKSLESTSKQAQNDLATVKRAVGMKSTLQNNLTLLKGLEEVLAKDIEDSLDSYKTKQKEIVAQVEQLSGYQISNLKFSYGTISASEADNPMSILDSLGASILELTVEDTSKLSKKKLEQADYYYNKYKGEAKGTEDVNIISQVVNSDLGALFSNIGAVFGGEKELSEVAAEGANTLIYQAYIKAYFKSYVSEESKFSKTPIKYEQEYILCGKSSDKKNLKQVAQRIVLLRTVADFTYLLTDSAKVQKARIAALALVGFTGIGVLVQGVQYGILAVWAYEEALVDTAALLQGYKVPLLKTNNTFMLNFADICTISKSKIQSKAKKLGKKKCVGAIQYEDYLTLFLLFEPQSQKTYRTMDLIEANMKLRHSDLFSFEDCIYGVTVSCEYSIPAKFTGLSLFSDWNYEENSWNFTKQQRYSY